MARNKYEIPFTLRCVCLSLIRDYDRLVSLYHQRRNDTIYRGISASVAAGCEFGISDKTANKTENLEKYEETHATYIIRAIEQAKLKIGSNIIADDQKELLTQLIWDCCIDGRNFSFEQQRGGLCYEKRQFYRYRAKFLKDISENLGLIF